MVTGAWAPDRGDVVWISMTPRVGHEQSGRRPALVLSPAPYNAKTGLALLCPLTTHVKGYPFEVVVPEGLPVQGVILADQMKSLDWRARDSELCCRLPADLVAEVLAKAGLLLTA